MEGVGSEVSLKIRSAIKAKLVELGTYVDEELPDYIMVLVANKKTKDQMDDDLSLFLGHNTERFTSWLHHVLQKLNAAALLQVTTPPEELKKKEAEEKKEKEEKKLEEKKREKIPEEDIKKGKDEEKRKSKEKDKPEKKRKSSERKKEKKDKKMKKDDSSPSSDKLGSKEKEKKLHTDAIKYSKTKEYDIDLEGKETKVNKEGNDLNLDQDLSKEDTKEPEPPKRKIRPLGRTNKISSADVFRAEADKEEEENETESDMLVLKAEDELGLDLEDEPAPKRIRVEAPKKAAEPKLADKEEVKPENDPAEAPKPRVSVKDRLGAPVTPKDKVSVLSRVSVVGGGKRIFNLHEELGSSGTRREDTGERGNSEDKSGMARAVSSAISSACRSVCILPTTTTSGKKLEARVRPLMSREVVSGSGTGRTSVRLTSKIETMSRENSGREGSSRSIVTSSRGDRSEVGRERGEIGSRGEVSSRSGSGRVVSAVGAVLKRSHSQVDSDEEEYDPKKPQLGGMASKVEVAPRPRRAGAIQANTALILRAVADAHKSVTKPRSRESTRTQASSSSSSKHKGELFSRSYREREREEGRQKERERSEGQKSRRQDEEIRVRKIAITVPNATREESKRQIEEPEEEMKVEEEGERERNRVKEVERTQVIVESNTRKDDSPTTPDQQPQLPEPARPPVIEEMEEVEEEELMETTTQPILPIATPAVNANTKFIVTLEGVDEEVEDLRGRMAVDHIPTTQVEEYIEEVEEWEEEEEETVEATDSTPAPAVTKAPPHSSLSLTHTGGVVSKERCKYWPICKTGDSCPYHHPTVPCKSFPACKFGDKCLFIHPNCIYDANCTRLGCPYTHASSRNFALASATASQKHKTVAPRPGSIKVKCKFFPKCTNMSCPFLHPKACFYGTSCTQPSCPFTHPAIPTGAKLKWVAPKIAAAKAAAASTPTTAATPTAASEATK